MNYQMLSMDELMNELDSVRMTTERIQAEIRQRADEELAKIEARKAELLALTAKPKIITIGGPLVKPRKAGAAKYRHPDGSGESWTGRGPKPKWMQTWIANGHDPNELRIAA